MRTILVDLPYKIKGFALRVEDEIIIVLNAHLSREANQQTYLHELKHISHNDLNESCDVNFIEFLRH